MLQNVKKLNAVEIAAAVIAPVPFVLYKAGEMAIDEISKLRGGSKPKQSKAKPAAKAVAAA